MDLLHIDINYLKYLKYILRNNYMNLIIDKFI